MHSVSSGLIILTPTQTADRGSQKQGSNPRPPDKSSAPLTDLPRKKKNEKDSKMRWRTRQLRHTCISNKRWTVMSQGNYAQTRGHFVTLCIVTSLATTCVLYTIAQRRLSGLSSRLNLLTSCACFKQRCYKNNIFDTQAIGNGVTRFMLLMLEENKKKNAKWITVKKYCSSLTMYVLFLLGFILRAETFQPFNGDSLYLFCFNF